MSDYEVRKFIIIYEFSMRGLKIYGEFFLTAFSFNCFEVCLTLSFCFFVVEGYLLP